MLRIAHASKRTENCGKLRNNNAVYKIYSPILLGYPTGGTFPHNHPISCYPLERVRQQRRQEGRGERADHEQRRGETGQGGGDCIQSTLETNGTFASIPKVQKPAQPGSSNWYRSSAGISLVDAGPKWGKEYHLFFKVKSCIIKKYISCLMSLYLSNVMLCLQQ